MVLDLDLRNAVLRGYCYGGWAVSLHCVFKKGYGHSPYLVVMLHPATSQFMRYSLLIFFLTPLLTFGQQEYEQALIESETGAYIIFTNDSNSFVLHLDTATVEPLGDGSNFLVLVDSTWTLQLFSIGYQNPNNKDTGELEVQKSFLLQYMNYELNYFKNEVKMKVENQSAGWGPVGNKYFLLWHFDTPEHPTVQKQMYLSTIVFDSFLNINVPLTNE
ncbi:hypothetical protein SAMN05421640_0015 [Ekhidna lutea]|uniref:Uncharacterized protein n=2 Tax=Ekhidna lutea TaxID=447679 RepID=A0A239MFG6_EKHLU|nr:hypothetical protein SAMN05421640_0015 [Ekhidna lutea]